MVKTKESKGVPKLKIEEAAAKKQALIDKGEEVIVGVNKFKIEVEEDIEILEVDNEKVKDSQIQKLEKLRSQRNEGSVNKALEALTKYAETGECFRSCYQSFSS